MTSAMAPPSRDWVEVCTIGDLLVRAASLWPDKEWIVFPEERYGYAAFLERAERASRSLLGLGVGPGDRVGILMPNSMDFLDVQYGCALIGVSAVPINARYKVRELRHILSDGELAAIATSDLISEYVPLPELLPEALEERPATLRHAIAFGGSHEGFLDRASFEAAAAGVEPEEVHRLRRSVCLRDEAMMMYTSGTTADPKGCVLTHEALVRTGMAAAERWLTVHEDRFWNALPMFHMSQVFPQLAHMHAGATIVTHTRFEPDVALETMERERITYAFTTFPVITQAVINHPRFDETDLSTVRLVNETGRAGDDPRRAAALRGAAGRDALRDDRVERRDHLGRAHRRRGEADHDRRLPAPRQRGARRRSRDRRGRAGRDARRDPLPRPGALRAVPQRPREDRPTRCAAAGSTPATAASSTTRAASRTWAGSRTCSRSAARTSPRSRSRRTSACTLR